MAMARRATKSTMMTNRPRATNLTMMASANDDDDESVTMVTLQFLAEAYIGGLWPPLN